MKCSSGRPNASSKGTVKKGKGLEFLFAKPRWGNPIPAFPIEREREASLVTQKKTMQTSWRGNRIKGIQKCHSHATRQTPSTPKARSSKADST